MWVYYYYYIFICFHDSWCTILAIVWVKDSKGSCANRERKWLRPSFYLRSPWCFCPTGRRNYSVQSHKGQQSRPSIPAAEAGDGSSSEPVIQDIRKTKTNRWEKRRWRSVALLAFCGAQQATDDGESCPTFSLTVHSAARLLSPPCLAPVRPGLETAKLSLFRLMYI